MILLVIKWGKGDPFSVESLERKTKQNTENMSRNIWSIIVVILGGNFRIGAHVRKDLFSFMRAHHVLSYHLI